MSIEALTRDQAAWHAVEYALRATETRNQVIADNIANAELPGFRASRVEFEERLARALSGSRPAPAPAVVPSQELPGPNDNNVRLDEELVSLIRSNLLQRAMVQAFNHKTSLFRAAIREVV